MNGATIHTATIPASDRQVFTVQDQALAAIIVEVLNTDVDPVAADVEVTVHPLAPNGQPYETGVDDLKLAEESVAAGQSAVLVDLKDAPGTGFAITVDNTDAVDHEVNINALVKG